MAPLLWEVVGGADKGGIVARAGKELASEQLESKLSTGAVVEELARQGDRLHYHLVKGQGPVTGWVSVRLKDKVLLEPVVAAPAGAAAQAPKAPPAQERSAARPDLSTRVEVLRERFPGTVDLEVPAEASQWSEEELQLYFESGGFIIPKRFKPQAPQPQPAGAAPKQPVAASPAKATSSTAAGRGLGFPAGGSRSMQMSTDEALKVQEQLRRGFGELDFQRRLSKLQDNYPKRKQRGHSDGPAFFEAFEGLALTVYSKILPSYGLSPDWNGVSDLYARMAVALKHPKVQKQHQEINALLGLPRETVLKQTKKVEEVFIYHPNGDGGVPGYPLPLVEDEDGDEAHAFFVEDPETGEVHLTKESKAAPAGAPPSGRSTRA